ncbi:MAG: ABC transporter permease [Candidatus Alectryocaccobium sp.]|jgi:ribose/xylose/arabinose/galactoside ABC-type transport system permease subunit
MNTDVKKTNIKEVLSRGRIFIIFLALFILMSILRTNSFLNYTNIMNLLKQISVNTILAVGMTLVMTTGCFDLSVGSVVGAVGIVVGLCAQSNMPIVVIFFVAAAVGAIFGVLNGLAIAIFKIPSFIVTLAMMQIARGVAYIISNGFPVGNFDKSYLVIGQGFFLGLPIPVYIMIIVVFLMWIVMSKTKFGRHVYFVGGNEESSRLCGINVFAIRVISHTLCSILAGIAAIVLTFRVASAMPGAGEGYEMDAIAASVIGGCSLNGGVSNMWGTLIGALILGIISNGMNLLGITTYPQMIIKGVIIFAAVLLDTRKK